MIFGLYMEIVNFFHESGGPYRVMDAGTCHNLIDALCHNRYFLDRDGQGRIVTFCDWWRVADVEEVKAGTRPADVESGDILFVVDCANRDRARKTMEIVWGHLAECPWVKKVAWFHKSIEPGRFRMYEVRHGEE